MLEGVGGQRHTLAAVRPAKEPWYVLDRKQELFRTGVEIEIRTLQPVASRFTDFAIQTTFHQITVELSSFDVGNIVFTLWDFVLYYTV
jgi:hypothetical protein